MITAISISDLCVVIISGRPMHGTFEFILLQWTVPWFQQNYECIRENTHHLHTNYKGIKNNTNFGQITGKQEELDTTCK